MNEQLIQHANNLLFLTQLPQCDWYLMKFNYANKTKCQLEFQNEGTSIKINKEHEDPLVALNLAVVAAKQFFNKGGAELLFPMLAAPTTEPKHGAEEAVILDSDDIPF